MSYRLSPLPPNWNTIRKEVFKRDEWVCQLRLDLKCTTIATEVHHAVHHADHRMSSLLSVCSSCHKTVTQQQAAAARWKFRDARPKSKHPGLH